MNHPISSKRGSALLIVLGLLSFLMISAVAFSISMRTERSAAAAYQRNLLGRELLASAFADARATTEWALKRQRDEAGSFDRDNPDTRTVEALAPFRYPGQDLYGRLITSRNTSTSELSASTQREPDKEPIAYLLDDTVMRHLPPAIAYNVYATLELQSPFYEKNHKGYDGKYYVDWTAGWKPISATIPTIESDKSSSVIEVSSTVKGRMAWAVINLSDMLDINGIASASSYRGIGLTGNEFAFGQAPGSTSTASTTEQYDLLDSSDTPASSQLDLPTFLSNADLAWYTARANEPLLITSNSSNVYPYSWESALSEEGVGAFSPFSVYSFWPHHTRTTEKTVGSAASTGSSGEPLITCDEVRAEDIGDPSSASSVGGRIEALYRKTLNESASLDAPESFLRLFKDYLDKDSLPSALDSDGGSDPDFLAQAQPTVENVPMVSDVSYTFEQNKALGSNFADKLAEEIKKAMEGKSPPDMPTEGYTSPDLFPKTLDEKLTLDLSVPEPEHDIALRVNFPGYEFSEESYSTEVEGFVATFGAAVTGDTNTSLTFKTEGASADFAGGSSGMTADGALFSEGTTTLKAGGKLKLELSGKDFPVANTAAAAPIQPATAKVRLSLLVDFLFRVKTTGTGGTADLCPVGAGKLIRLRANYPKKLSDRLNSTQMERFDGQYFRITRPVTAEFAIEWEPEEVMGENGAIVGYKCKTKLSDAIAIEPKVEPAADFEMNANSKLTIANATTPSFQTLSPAAGVWSAVDPRYNWLSPMLGMKGTGAEYFGSGGIAPLPTFSSPHWTFVQDEQITGGTTTASDVATAYAEAHAEIVPFSWGLRAEAIRYGYNDTDQLLLPGEVAFIPVPLASNVWGDKGGYLTNTYADYHDKVARQSFYRTLPVADFKDGAMDYNKYVKLASMFQSFSGENFPEEHRALVNVFAGQDDYVLCQRLRQLALLGIAPTIRQAAKVTYDRLDAAQKAGRASDKLLADLDSLKDIEIPGGTLQPPKYDDFIRDYLFPLPKTSGGVGAKASDWEKEQTLYKGITGKPTRPKSLKDFIIQDAGSGTGSFADRILAYNTANTSKVLGQNDVTTLVASASECFGDRQQLFLYILRADTIAYNSGRDLSQHRPMATSRAVALVWRDAYGELPDRVIYYQLLP